MKLSSALSTGILLMAVLVTSGCWDRTEVNDLALVMAAGLDETKDGKLLSSVQIAIPSQLSGGQSGTGSTGGDPSKTFIIEKATGRDVHDIEQKLQEQLSRRLYIAHRRVLLIGERLAKKGIKNVLDQYGRDPASRLRTYVLVSKGMDAYQMLAIPSKLERVPAEAIREAERSGIGTEVTLRDLLMAASSEGITPYMAALEVHKPQKSNQGAGNTNQEAIRLADTAIFKNYKLVGYLNASETRGLLWVTGKMQKGVITSYVPEGKGDVSLTITRAERKVKTDVKNGKVKIAIDVYCEGVVHENNTNLDLNRPVNIQRIEKVLRQDLQGRIQTTLNKAQKEYQADIFGFGQDLHRHHPSEWKKLRTNWETNFSKADIALTVNLAVLRSGMSGPPLQLPEDQVESK